MPLATSEFELGILAERLADTSDVRVLDTDA